MEPMPQDWEAMNTHWLTEKKSKSEDFRSLQIRLMLLEPTMGYIKKQHMRSVCVMHRLWHHTWSEKFHLP